MSIKSRKTNGKVEMEPNWEMRRMFISACEGKLLTNDETQQLSQLRFPFMSDYVAIYLPANELEL